MPNPDDIEKLLRAFLDLVFRHPWISVPIVIVALVWGITSIIKAGKEQLGWVFRIVHSGSKKERTILGLSFGLVVLIAGVAPPVVSHFKKAKPVFLDLKPSIMTQEFTARWTYSEDKNGEVRYKLVAVSGDQKEEFLTTIPYHKIGLSGKVTVTVTAVSKDGSSVTSDPVTFEIYKNSVERIKATKTIIIGIHADDNPGLFCYNSPDAGYQGFDIDLSREISHELQRKYQLPESEPKFVFFHWPELLDEPAKHEVDYVIASISRTGEREQKYGIRFSRPYYTTQVGLIRKMAPNNRPVRYGELAGLNVAANRFTTASNFADALKLRVTKADTKQEVFALLADQKVDGIIYDFVRSLSEASSRNWKTNEIDYQTIPTGLRPKPEQYAIAFATVNDELRGDVDEILSRLDTEKMIRDRIKY